MHLVGAGPGDPELLTLKARRLLHEADVVVHDRLVPPAILELARREARIVEVGKTAVRAVLEAGRHQRADRRARPSPATRVVRLKGGDPAVFGRLDEEIEALEAAGVALRHRAGDHLGQRRRGGDRPVADQARAQLRVPHPDRARRGRLRRARLARAGAAGLDGGDLHGREGLDLPARAAPDARRAGRRRR